MLLLRPRAEQAFVLGGEVGLGRVGPTSRSASRKCTTGISVGQLGQPHAEQLDVLGGRSPISASIPASTSPQHGEHVAVVVDEAELDVERDVLGEVAHRVVRLGAEHRPDLVDALEHPDHHLLVELRRLRQVRRAAEVVHA